MLDNKYFETEVMTNKKPALIAFTAEWCRPCGIQKTVILSLAEKYRDEFIIGVMNVDTEEELAKKYRASTLPTMAFFAKGELLEVMPGFQSEEFLESCIKSILAEQDSK